MYRIGFGTDQHRYSQGSGIVLGGIVVPAEYAVVAHSDGDVLIHALVDALLGAVARGDIGELFPDTLEENKGRSSVEFLIKAIQIVEDEGYEVVNIDSTIQAQSPKLMKYKRRIADNLAEIIGVDSTFMSVKAKTAEGMDAIGRCEGIRADVAVMVRRRNDR